MNELYVLGTSKNGRYNYPSITDTNVLKQLVQELKGSLGKDIVGSKVIYNENATISYKRIRKVNSNIKLPSLNTKLL